MNLEILCNQVVTISKEVGNYLIKEQEKLAFDDLEIKGRNDFVSYVDKNAERKFAEKLLVLLPQSGFLGEEDQMNIENSDLTWIVDPLDGTTNYIHQIPIYSTSVALVSGGEIVLGVVHIPLLDECFYAWKNGSAFLNGDAIHCSGTTSIENSLLATGFPYTNFDYADDYLRLFKALMLASRGMRRMGSAAIDLVYTACGRFDGFYEIGLNAWDVAAGAIIVNEAGGKTSDFKGTNNYVFGKSILSTNRPIHSELLTFVEEHF